MSGQNDIIEEFKAFLGQHAFPCVAAKDALRREHIRLMTATHIACPADDYAIIEFLYRFAEEYRQSSHGFYTAAIIFKGPCNLDEDLFEQVMWQRLSCIQKTDAISYPHDTRVSSDPDSPAFSFSIMGEAFFVLAMHPHSSRRARQFKYPVLVFNPHAQFEAMKKTASYDKMKAVVRKRDIAFSGSVNPMLADFGERSEAFQYSGRQQKSDWKCPLNNQEI